MHKKEMPGKTLASEETNPVYTDKETAPSNLDVDQQDIFIRGIVHDLNNHLMAILASCDNIEISSKIIVELPEHLALVRSHVHYSSSLLRDMANSQNMDRAVIMTKDELHHFLETILPSLCLIAGRNATVEIGSVITSRVHVNRKPLLRVLLQLIRNAAETGTYHPLAYISAREIGKWCEISVSDNGPGLVNITPEEIFQPGTTTRGKQGSRGYGLSTVARAVQDWGGEYGVETMTNDQGCRFWIRLPLA